MKKSYCFMMFKIKQNKRKLVNNLKKNALKRERATIYYTKQL